MKKTKRTRAWLEQLEDRLTPSVVYEWVPTQLTTNGNNQTYYSWATGKNWLNTTNNSTGTVPGSTDEALFDSGSTAGCVVDTNEMVGSLVATTGFTQNLFLLDTGSPLQPTNLTVTGDVISPAVATSWQGSALGAGDVDFLNPDATIWFGNTAGFAVTHTFSGPGALGGQGTANLGNNDPAQPDVAGNVYVYQGSGAVPTTLVFASTFSHFGANIVLGYNDNEGNITAGNLTFASSLSGSVTDDYDANISVHKGTMSCLGGGIAAPTSGQYAHTAGQIFLSHIDQNIPTLSVAASVTFVCAMGVDNIDGQTVLNSGSKLEITGGVADAGQADNGASYRQEGGASLPFLSLGQGADLKCDQLFYASAGSISLSGTAATLDGVVQQGGTYGIYLKGTQTSPVTVQLTAGGITTNFTLNGVTDFTWVTEYVVALSGSSSVGSVSVGTNRFDDANCTVDVTGTGTQDPGTQNYYFVKGTSITGNNFSFYLDLASTDPWTTTYQGVTGLDGTGLYFTKQKHGGGTPVSASPSISAAPPAPGRAPGQQVGLNSRRDPGVWIRALDRLFTDETPRIPAGRVMESFAWLEDL